LKNFKQSSVYFLVFGIFVLLIIFVFINQQYFFKKLKKTADLNLHNSYFSQKTFFEDAYRLAKTSEYQPLAKGILVNHHLLASSYIAEAFNSIATTGPVTVILISPNHFSSGKNDVITSAFSWQTPYGILEPNLFVVSELEKKQVLAIDESPFKEEHGISGIVPFVKKSLPNAKIVPLILKDRLSLEKTLILASEMNKVLPTNTIVVGSFDFSHYLTSRASDFHDLESLNAIYSFDLKSVYNLDIDSRPGLALFLQILKSNQAEKFSLLQHSNSSKLTSKDFLETTSYITGYFSLGKPKSESVGTLLSLGNIESNLNTLELFEKQKEKYAFTFLERLFYGQDEVITFLTTDNAVSKQVKKIFELFFKVQTIQNEKIEKQLGGYTVTLLDFSKKTVNDVHAEIDRGSEIVICQNAFENKIEIYNKKLIIYASGNLLDKTAEKKELKSMAVGLSVNENTKQIFLLPIGFKNGQLKLLIGEEADKILVDIVNKSNVPNNLKEQIKLGIINNY
jgi:AmmeMemoRadiSam system protein B